MTERKPTLLEYGELLLTLVLRRLPVTWVSAFGAYMGARRGRKAIAAGRVWVARLHANFERFSGIKDADQREKMIVEYASHIGRVYAEFTVLQRLVAAGRVEVIGREHLDNVSCPAIVASCHLANWELLGHVLAMLKGGTCDLYDPPENPIRHRLVLKARRDWGDLARSKFVSASPTAMREVIRALVGGWNLLMLVDEEIDEYICAPSLGRRLPDSGNRWFTARLAARYAADILPMHVEVVGPAKYRIVIEPKLASVETDAEARTRDLALQMDRCFERWIRAHPEHWYWLHLYEHDRVAYNSGQAVTSA